MSNSSNLSLASALLGNNIVWTPEVERLGQKVAGLMERQLPGSYVTGIQRGGKSYGCRYLVTRMSEFLGRPVIGSRLIVQTALPDREGSLIAEWAGQEGVPLNSNVPSRVRKTMKEYFWEEAKRVGAVEMLILVDEAQNATRKHLGHLMAFAEILMGPDVVVLRPFILLTGQPELSAFVASFQDMEEMQLVGRFFERPVEFQAISPEDIPVVLEAYETEVKTPDGKTEPPAIAKHFPEAWAAGWRIKGWAPAIRTGFADLAVSSGLPKDQRIPFQHLHSTLAGLLLYVKALGDATAQITPQVVHNAITETGLHGTWARYAALSKKKQ